MKAEIFIAAVFLIFAGCTGVVFLYYLVKKTGERKISGDEEEVSVIISETEGSKTQLILDKIRKGEYPFEKNEEMDLRLYKTYDGTVGMGVYVNGIKIGDIPDEKREFFSENANRFIEITDLNIREDKKTKALSCEIKTVFKKI